MSANLSWLERNQSMEGEFKFSFNIIPRNLKVKHPDIKASWNNIEIIIEVKNDMGLDKYIKQCYPWFSLYIFEQRNRHVWPLMNLNEYSSSSSGELILHK